MYSEPQRLAAILLERCRFRARSRRGGSNHDGSKR
jgi:hypothetical protein